MSVWWWLIVVMWMPVTLIVGDKVADWLADR